MLNGLRGAFCVAVLCLVGCGGGGGTGVIGGKVTFSDASDAAGLPVTLLGPTGKRIATSAGGAYSFDKLPKGVYQISVDAPDTKERRLSFGTESDGSQTIAAPDLMFSALGSLTGKVMNAAGPAPGVTVYLSGSDRVALTDAMGSYGFFDVPTGDYSVVAKGSGAFPQQASAMVKLKRGKNDAMPLTLSNDLAVTGKIEGTIALFNGASPKDIKVSVADISAMTNDTGGFTLTLPPGEYEPIAELAAYPKQSLGFATVRAGQTTTLPVKTLSSYKAFAWASRISAASWVATSEGDVAVMQVSVGTDYGTESYFVDIKTFARKLFAIGGIYGQYLSKNGKWVAFIPNNSQAVVAINSGTGQVVSVPAANVQSGPVISNDEATLMFYAGAPQNSLVRVDLNTGVSTSVAAFGNSFFQTNERFLARTTVTSPFDVQLVTVTGATTVFNNATTLVGSVAVTLSNNTYGSSVAWVSNCVVACNVQVLGPTATTASTVSTANITAVPFAITGSVKDWLGLTWAGATPGRALVKVSDGSSTALPATTSSLLFNETMSRVATYSIGALAYEVREDVVPPNANSIVHMTSPAFPVGAWLSPTRFMVFGSGAPRRVDIKSGIAVPDSDVTFDTGPASSPLFFAPGVIWVKTSNSKRLAAVSDSATDFTVDGSLGITANYNFSAIGSKSSVATPVLGKFAGFSDSANVYVLDGVKSELRKVGVGEIVASGSLFVPTDRMKVTRLGGTELQFFESGRLISLSEPGLLVSSAGIASPIKAGVGTLSVAIMGAEPKNILYLTAIP